MSDSTHIARIGQPDAHGQEPWPTPKAVPFGIDEVERVAPPGSRRRSVAFVALGSLLTSVVAAQLIRSDGFETSPASDALAAALVATFFTSFVVWRARRRGQATDKRVLFAFAFLMTFLVQRAGAWLF